MSLSKFAIPAALLSLANALPQKPDFNAIAAAPTVASGPSALNGDAEQTAALYTSFTVTGATTAPSAAATAGAKRGLPIQKRDQVISRDVTDSNYNAQFGTFGQLTTVASGVDYWINGGSTHNFFGNINNNGRIFVSQTNYLRTNRFAGGQTSDWVGHDQNNGNLINAAGALIQLNDFGSASAPTYDWYIRSMQNKGTIQWCGRGDTGGSTYQMYNDITSTNDGLISFEQFFDNKGAAFVWRNPVLYTTSPNGQNLYNNGAFRIINVNYHNVQNVYGIGCWQIGKGGILYLEDGTGVFQNPTRGPSFPGQSISFQDSSAVLHMDTAVYSRNSNFGARVYGFGQGNAIEFYQTISSFSYTASTGVLNVRFIGSNQVNIRIGTGYDATKFANRRNPQKYANYNAIFYDGAAPSQSAPSQCGITAPVCSDLSNGLPPKSSGPGSSSSSSSSASSTVVPSTTASSTTRASTIVSASTTASGGSSSTASTTASGGSSSTVSQTSASRTSTSISTTAGPTTTQPPRTPKSCPNTSYTPYYPALATSYTTDPALSATRTTTAGQPCVTNPEAGTYCGFINPLDPCAPQPDGFGPVPTPDTASAFLAFDRLHASASAAPTVVPSSDGTQYTQVFKDLNGATSAQSYLGLYTLKSYDVAECAAKCDCTELCTSFNLYAERDPSLNPTNNDSTYDPGYPTVWGQNCPNPASQTSFKCTLWGSSIDSTTATNTGETRSQFQVVITASNGYDKTSVTAPPSDGNAPQNANAKAIDAPQYSLGSKFFPGPYNSLVCAAYANEQSVANSAAGTAKVAMCNAYYLHKDGKPQGTVCSLYNSALDVSKWATYTGSDGYAVKQSWVFTL